MDHIATLLEWIIVLLVILLVTAWKMLTEMKKANEHHQNISFNVSDIIGLMNYWWQNR